MQEEPRNTLEGTVTESQIGDILEQINILEERLGLVLLPDHPETNAKEATPQTTELNTRLHRVYSRLKHINNRVSI